MSTESAHIPPTENAQTEKEIYTPKDPGNIRITTSGKMRLWVTYALDFLQKEDNKPLTLHTLPRDLPPSASSSQCTHLIPRLISVVEIIKREYVQLLAGQKLARLHGLHQYNILGNVEDLIPEAPDGASASRAPVPDEGEARAQRISDMLDGAKNHVKQKQTPYMKVVLSLNELPDLIDQGATYQSPLKRKQSKSAKARAKKRQRKSRAEGSGDPAARGDPTSSGGAVSSGEGDDLVT